MGGLVLRHAPTGEAGEIAGHLHPKARLRTRRRHLSCRCFAADADRLLLPALGSFTGGLNVLDPAIHRLFPHRFSRLSARRRAGVPLPAPRAVRRAGRPEPSDRRVTQPTIVWFRNDLRLADNPALSRPWPPAARCFIY